MAAGPAEEPGLRSTASAISRHTGMTTQRIAGPLVSGSEDRLGYWTVIVPTIPSASWGMQISSNVPASSNVNVTTAVSLPLIA